MLKEEVGRQTQKDTGLGPALRIAMVVALAVTGGLFVYSWLSQGFTAATWLLLLGWMPLILWNYRALQRGDVVAVGVSITASFALLILTVMAAAGGNGGPVGLLTGILGLLMFGSMIAAGSVMWQQASEHEERSEVETPTSG